MIDEGWIDVTFAGATVRFEHRGRRAARIVSFVWRGITRQPSRPPVLPCCLEDIGSHELRLRVANELSYEGSSEGTAAARVLEVGLYHLADRSRGGLVLHAACVADAGGGVLLPGLTGTGKTTLTSWLVAHGWRYLTDELVFVAEGSLVVSGLARPLNVKAPALRVLRQFCDLHAHRDDTMTTPVGVLLRPSVLGATRPAGRAAVARIVFPRYVPRAACTLTPISPAQAGARLMGCLINARNLDRYGFPEVTRLVRQVPAYELRYGSVGQLADWRR